MINIKSMISHPLPMMHVYVSIGYGSIEEVSMIVIFLHMSPPLHLVHFLVLVVLELGVIAGDGAGEVHLLELLLRLGQRLVLKPQLPQQPVHVLVFVELSQGLGHELDGQLGHQGDLRLLGEFQLLLHVELLLEQTRHHLLLHLQLLLALLRLLIEFGPKLQVTTDVRPLILCSSSSMRCLQSIRVKTGLLARYSISFLKSVSCFFSCFLVKQSVSRLNWQFWGVVSVRTAQLSLPPTTLIITINYIQGDMSEQQTEKSMGSSHLIQTKRLPIVRFFFVALIIIATSYTVYSVNVRTLQHARNFTRTLHYHVLNHQTIGVYWFGQQMLNYPIHEFFQLSTFQQFLQNVHEQMGHLEDISYGMLDQAQLNATRQEIKVFTRDGMVESYNWTLQDGPQADKPFAFDDVQQIKRTFIASHSVDIKFAPINLGSGNIWNINIHIEPFSVTSIIVTFMMNQQVSLAKDHILSFIFGLILGAFLLRQYLKKRQSLLQNFLLYFLCLFLVVTSLLAFSEAFPFEFIFMLDGLTCCSAWLCALRFYTKEDDYKLSFLLTKSYGMIGRLFASFGPLLIAFSIFGYCVFSRYSGQFSSFWRTFTSLFYICYYNMTYESAIVTGRSNPISMIFFITFVLLFTICIYSSMLVSVFCSYVWGKREEQIKQDIVANLKIQCSSCDHKYRYADRSKLKPKVSFNLSEFLEIDWKNPDECVKYKRVMAARIKRLREQTEIYLQENSKAIKQGNFSMEVGRTFIEDLWTKKRYIKNLIGSNQY